MLNVGECLSDYTPAVDMWSVGVVLFVLLSGYSPFDDDDESVLYDKIRKVMPALLRAPAEASVKLLMHLDRAPSDHFGSTCLPRLRVLINPCCFLQGLYDIDDPIWDSVSIEAKDLVAKLLMVDVSLRLSAREALNHPFVQRARNGGSSSMMTG